MTKPSRHTAWFLMGYYALAAAWGIRQVWMSEHSGLDLIFTLLSALLLGWWAIVDAERRNHPIPMMARAWFLLFAGIVVPGYVIWTRGWRGLGWLLLHASCLYLLSTVAMNAAGFAVYGADWLEVAGAQ